MINDTLRCRSCKVSFNDAENIPFVAECGHTFCFQCLFQSGMPEVVYLNLSSNAKHICPIDSRLIESRNAIKNLIVLELLKLTENGSTKHAEPEVNSHEAESYTPKESYRKPSVRISIKKHDNSSPTQIFRAKALDTQPYNRRDENIKSRISEELSDELIIKNNILTKSINRSMSQKYEENTQAEDQTNLERTKSNTVTHNSNQQPHNLKNQLINESIKPGLSIYLRCSNKSEKNTERCSVPIKSPREMSAIKFRNDSKKKVSLNDKGRVNVVIIEEQALKVDLCNSKDDSSKILESDANVRISNRASSRTNDHSFDTIPLLEDKSIIDQSFREDCNNLFCKDNGRSNLIKPRPETNYEVLIPNSGTSPNDLKIDVFIIEYLNCSKRKLINDAGKDLGLQNGKKIIRTNYLQYIEKAISSKFVLNFTQSIKDMLSNNNVSFIYRITRSKAFFVGFKIHTNTQINEKEGGLRQILSIKSSLGSNYTLTGCLFLENGDYYEGSLDNIEAKFGKGFLCYLNNITYEGQFLNGMQHGVGKLCQPDGEVYIGEWKEGKINGVGSRFHSNGDKYDGNYVNNIRSGYGEYTFSNGDKYAGNWENGKASGKGKFMFANGSIYEGEFQANQIFGKGSMHLANGDVFRGDSNNGKLNGNGYSKSSNGSTYKGEFLNGKKHGFGIFFDFEQSLSYNGQWIEDKYIGPSNSSSNKKLQSCLNYH